jgi:hypothetical protein
VAKRRREIAEKRRERARRLFDYKPDGFRWRAWKIKELKKSPNEEIIIERASCARHVAHSGR